MTGCALSLLTKHNKSSITKQELFTFVIDYHFTPPPLTYVFELHQNTACLFMIFFICSGSDCQRDTRQYAQLSVDTYIII